MKEIDVILFNKLSREHRFLVRQITRRQNFTYGFVCGLLFFEILTLIIGFFL